MKKDLPSSAKIDLRGKFHYDEYIERSSNKDDFSFRAAYIGTGMQGQTKDRLKAGMGKEEHDG
ncbi:hypothetical protein [Paenibacillus macerans]|uniref:hypothetical protein n=1 Tax=Paenibacillus macerans TaxID=44252 RepID=UPI003D31FCFE